MFKYVSFLKKKLLKVSELCYTSVQIASIAPISSIRDTVPLERGRKMGGQRESHRWRKSIEEVAPPHPLLQQASVGPSQLRAMA